MSNTVLIHGSANSLKFKLIASLARTQVPKLGEDFGGRPAPIPGFTPLNHGQRAAIGLNPLFVVAMPGHLIQIREEWPTLPVWEYALVERVFENGRFQVTEPTFTAHGLPGDAVVRIKYWGVVEYKTRFPVQPDHIDTGHFYETHALEVSTPEITLTCPAAPLGQQDVHALREAWRVRHNPKDHDMSEMDEALETIQALYGKMDVTGQVFHMDVVGSSESADT